MLWVWLSKLWDGWRDVIVIVKPETVLAWHRRVFRLYWTGRADAGGVDPVFLRTSAT
jgi:hypothetical protein